jgi:hypothetical protein
MLRNVTALALLAIAVILAALLWGAGTASVLAQAQPTATFNLSGVLGRTAQPAAPAIPTSTPSSGGILAIPTSTPSTGEIPAAPETPAAVDTPTGERDVLLVWPRVEAGFESMVFEGVTVGGPVDMYSIIGDPCAQNVFSAELPVMEFHLLSDSPQIRIGFVADDGSATAIAMWDPIQEIWWCNIEAQPGSEVSFAPLVAGDYPFYVGVLNSTGTVTGTFYLTEEEAAAQ